MEKMSSVERVAYAHGKIQRDMQEFQRQIDDMHSQILRERNLWLLLVAISTILITIIFIIASPTELIEFAVIGVVLASFTIIRFLSYRIIKNQIKMVESMQGLYSQLANDETIGFVTESMRIESIEEQRHAVLPEPAELTKQLMGALRVISAMIDEIEKERINNSGYDDDTKRDSG